MLAWNGKLSLRTLIAIAFSYDILCMLQIQVKTTGSYNTTTHQMTPLLLRMLRSTLKASEKLQSASYDPVLVLTLSIDHNMLPLMVYYLSFAQSHQMSLKGVFWVLSFFLYILLICHLQSNQPRSCCLLTIQSAQSVFLLYLTVIAFNKASILFSIGVLPTSHLT